MERRRRNKDLFGRRGRESVLQVQNPKGRGRWTGLFYSIRFYSDSMGGGWGLFTDCSAFVSVVIRWNRTNEDFSFVDSDCENLG